MKHPNPALDLVEVALPQSLDRLFDFIRIKSVSTDPAFAPACQQAAEWCSAQLRDLGFEAGIHATAGQPIVLGHLPGPDDAPHVLFYGHYDVQPADPAALWERDAFSPWISERDGIARITGRGASDDKGQIMTFLEALRALKSADALPPLRITVLIEGEEEIGSRSLEPFLRAHAGDLDADVVLICDTPMWDAATPAVTTRLRGLLAEEVRIGGASRDLHSGVYGGAAPNPIRILATILAGLHDTDGRVMLPGFYDDVGVLPDRIRAQWSGLDFDAEAFLAAVGVAEPMGENGYSVLEQVWARPTLEFNGISGGYAGVGSKTVIPAEASAKITFRLVGRQDPERIRASLHRFIEDRLPPGTWVEFLGAGAASPAIEVADDSPAVNTICRALEAEWSVAPVLMGCGGSIPVVESFKTVLGKEAILVGFALNEDAVHSPNESYRLSSFCGGIRSWVRILEQLAKDQLPSRS